MQGVGKAVLNFGDKKVYLACGYTDMRRGINGLAAQVQQQYRLDPRIQAVFLFCSKGRFAKANLVAKRLILTTPADLAKSPFAGRKLPKGDFGILK